MFGNSDTDEDNMKADEATKALDEFAGQIHAALYQAAARFAVEFDQHPDIVYADIVKRLVANLPTGVKSASDGRAVAYRVRLTLFEQGTLVADTDPDSVMNTAGSEVIYGLQAVGEWAREIASGYYSPQDVNKLDNATVAKSIKSLRPSLSRNEGTHNWRLPFTVDGTEGYLANILVVTEQDETTTP